MKTSIMKAFGAIALSGVVAILPAQNNRSGADLNREMTLERAYDPSVQDANKVNTLPAVREPVVTKIPIDYATLSVPFEPKREISLLSPTPVMSDMQYNTRRGYLNLGAGNYTNLNGDAGYHILATGKDRLNIFFSHRSTNGNVKYLTGDSTVKAKLNDNLGGINYRHRFDLSALSIGAKYDYATFNYYGAGVPSFPLTDTAINQASGALTLNAGIESVEDAPVGYLLAADYTRFAYKYNSDGSSNGITEHSIGVKAGLNTEFAGNQRIGIGGKLNYFNYALPSAGDSVSPATPASFENYLEATLTPYYLIEDNTWNIRIGVNLMGITGANKKLFLSPNVAANLLIGSKTSLYLNADGQIRSNSAYQLSRENRYINPSNSVAPSRTSLDAVAGIKSAAIAGFRFNLFAQYKITADNYYFIPYRNMSCVLSQDAKQFRAGLELQYGYNHLFDVAVQGIFSKTQISPKERHTYGRPNRQCTATFNFHPLDRLDLSLNYYLAAGRRALLYDYNNDIKEVEVQMKDISELNFVGSYTFNDTFGAYLKLNNLLFQRYEYIYGYPQQGFNLMAGININF